MFDSDLDREGRGKLSRRLFLSSTAAAIGGLALWQWKMPALLGAESADEQKDLPKEVTVILFDDSGKKLKKTTIPRVVKSLDEWRKQLPSGVFDITRRADTEVAYTGKYWNLHDKGIYRCICCDNALFDSMTKFDSGTGWPSFWAPIADQNVREKRDSSLGMIRTEVLCTECDAHLGHVFDDGPQPTGLRYCMNSASLRFVKRT
jgi:peptide-methionine (R)-S-oxide reductase